MHLSCLASSSYIYMYVCTHTCKNMCLYSSTICLFIYTFQLSLFSSVGLLHREKKKPKDRTVDDFSGSVALQFEM